MAEKHTIAYEYHTISYHTNVKDKHSATVYSENAIFLLFLSTLGHGSDKLSFKLWWPRKGLPNCKFHDPWGRSSCARAWPCKSLLWKGIIFFFINIQHIDCYCIKGCFSAFLCHCWFLFILWWGCWYANISPSEVSLESLILRWP